MDEALKVFSKNIDQYQSEFDGFNESRFIKDNGAIFNYSHSHRYFLWRKWDRSSVVLCFIGINPSTADDKKNDPTTKKCISIAKRLGYGGICIINLFTLIETDPSKLVILNPFLLNTPNSEYWWEFVRKSSMDIVFMWGNSAEKFQKKMREAEEFFRECNVYCFGKTMLGYPKHPLYIPSVTPLIPY